MNELFRALDDATRRQILDLLGERDRTAGELAAAFKLGKPTISHHLGLLRRAGLVSARKEKQSVVYRLEATVLDECAAWFMQLLKRNRSSTHENAKRPARRAAATADPDRPLRALRPVVG